MFSTSRLNRLALSASTVAITVVGSFSPVIFPIAVQAAPACSPQSPLTGLTLPGNVPAAARTQATRAGNSVANPDVPLTRFTRQVSSGVRTIEQTGRQTATATSAVPGNGCLLEVDVVVTGTPPNEQVVGVEEVEEQIAIQNQSTLPTLPAAVRNRLRGEGFTAARFQVTFLERSRRYSPPQNFPSNAAIAPDEIIYEIEGTCTANNLPYCTSGQSGEAQISADGTSFLFEPST